jgi:hypothetical protein
LYWLAMMKTKAGTITTSRLSSEFWNAPMGWNKVSTYPVFNPCGLRALNASEYHM